MNKIIIKKHNNKNEYILMDRGFWVRDFTNNSKPVDVNKLIPESEYEMLVRNQIANSSLNIASIDMEKIYTPNVIIVSDGYKFAEQLPLLSSFRDVTIIGTNRSLTKWSSKVKMDYYVVNNPYKECLSYLPSSYYPKCIVSCRTNPEFVSRYRARKGVIYKYIPVPDKRFGGVFENPRYYIDDYRNPICAAISLAYRWGVRKLALFCCDDVFDTERSGAEKLANGLWMYPQHYVSHNLIDGSLYWLTKNNKNMQVVNCSSGPDCKNASYIPFNDLIKFF